jgi:hypothetical protein
MQFFANWRNDGKINHSTPLKPMTKAISRSAVIAAIGMLLTGCISHQSTVYQDAERTRVEFESDAAARLFYETLSKTSGYRDQSESTTTVAIPFLFSSERKVLPGRNVEFNAAVAACDVNRDGKITEQEAKIFANHH